MSITFWFTLTSIKKPYFFTKINQRLNSIQFSFALQEPFKRLISIKMILNSSLLRASYKHNICDSTLCHFLNNILNYRLIKHRQHFFWHGLGSWQKSSPHPSNGNNSFGYFCLFWHIFYQLLTQIL